MPKNKFQSGCYLLQNVAIIELSVENDTQYSVKMLFSNPTLRLALGSAGTVIDFDKFESIVNTYGKELIPVDSTKAEIVGLLYGSGV